MAVHTIRIPDYSELRVIVWDDEAGTVVGDHSGVEFLRQVFAAKKPVTVGDPGWMYDLVDPAHSPSEFLAALWAVYARVVDEPLRSTLPPVFDGVELPAGIRGDFLYDEDGNELN